MRQRASPDTSSDELGQAKILTHTQTYSKLGTGLQHLETSLWCVILGENFVNILSKLEKKKSERYCPHKAGSISAKVLSSCRLVSGCKLVGAASCSKTEAGSSWESSMFGGAFARRNSASPFPQHTPKLESTLPCCSLRSLSRLSTRSRAWSSVKRAPRKKKK